MVPVILAAWLVVLGTAVLSDLLAKAPEGESRTRRIGLCLLTLHEEISAADGILRIRAEICASCHTLVVECLQPPEGIPGEIDGIPVRVRFGPERQELDPAEAAARELTRQSPRSFLPRDAGDGSVDLVSGDGEGNYSVLSISGARELEEAASSIARRRSIRSTTERTSEGTLVIFSPRGG